MASQAEIEKSVRIAKCGRNQRSGKTQHAVVAVIEIGQARALSLRGQKGLKGQKSNIREEGGRGGGGEGQTIENSPCLFRVEPTCKLIQRAALAASAATWPNASEALTCKQYTSNTAKFYEKWLRRKQRIRQQL